MQTEVGVYDNDLAKPEGKDETNNLFLSISLLASIHNYPGPLVKHDALAPPWVFGRQSLLLGIGRVGAEKRTLVVGPNTTTWGSGDNSLYRLWVLP